MGRQVVDFDVDLLSFIRRISVASRRIVYLLEKAETRIVFSMCQPDTQLRILTLAKEFNAKAIERILVSEIEKRKLYDYYSVGRLRVLAASLGIANSGVLLKSSLIHEIKKKEEENDRRNLSRD